MILRNFIGEMEREEVRHSEKPEGSFLESLK